MLLWVEAGVACSPASFAPPTRVVRCSDLDDAARQLAARAWDAVVICAPAELAAQLPSMRPWREAMEQGALLVVTNAPDADLCERLVRAGVQDVLDVDEAGSPAMGGRLAMAIARKQRERDARRAWSTDLQTGLPHRAQLLEHLSELLALRARQPAVMALLAVVIDGIDAAVAAHGEEAAQVLRRKVAVRLRGAVRASDVVASLGDDAFALLLAKIEAAGDAQRVAAKVARLLREPFRVLGATLGVRGHVGVAVAPGDGDDAQRLLDQALDAARLAQRAGRPAAND